jgi:hypothetical protein
VRSIKLHKEEKVMGGVEQIGEPYDDDDDRPDPWKGAVFLILALIIGAVIGHISW